MSCPAGRAAICPLGHVCHYVMAQIWPTDQEALEKEGSQMAVCCLRGYWVHCSLLRSGELGEGQHPARGCMKSLATRSLLLASIFSQDPQILLEQGLCNRFSSEKLQRARWFWKAQHTLHAHPVCMGSTCPARTDRHHTNEHETGLGHNQDKDLKISWQAEKFLVALKPYSAKLP